MGKKMNLETKSFVAAISFALCCSSLSATAANTATVAFPATAASSTSVASSESSKNVELSAVLPAQHYQPTKENLQSRQEFQDDKFGIFLHWGLYSMLATGEWTMTNKDLNYKEYAKLAGGFYPSKFDAAKWLPSRLLEPNISVSRPVITRVSLCLRPSILIIISWMQHLSSEIFSRS